MFFVKHGVISVDDMRAFARELCFEPHLACPTLLAWLRANDAENTRAKCRTCPALYCEQKFVVNSLCWCLLMIFLPRCW